MTDVDIRNLISKHGLVSDQIEPGELAVILRELVARLAEPGSGAVVEFGCYRGTTSLYIRRILNASSVDRPFHVYDSFEGLPEKSAQDNSPAGLQFASGELRVSKKDFLMEFKKANLRPPFIHKGWFADLTPSDVPSLIDFAFLDGDYYDSVKASLHLIEDKLAPGATIIVDDYANEALPGAARAVDEWAGRRGITPKSIRSLAVMKIAQLA